MATSPPSAPETYYLRETLHVPNNTLPALVYRDVLPKPASNTSAQQLCEANHWDKRGEWGEIKTAHFHPNTHECYAIFQGSSRIVLGRARGDENPDGAEIDVSVGDVVVVPAGVSHRSLFLSPDYRYIGVYPNESPRWRSNYCKGEEDMGSLRAEIGRIEIPAFDPVYGKDGPLPEIWRMVKG